MWGEKNYPLMNRQIPTDVLSLSFPRLWRRSVLTARLPSGDAIVVGTVCLWILTFLHSPSPKKGKRKKKKRKKTGNIYWIISAFRGCIAVGLAHRVCVFLPDASFLSAAVFLLPTQHMKTCICIYSHNSGSLAAPGWQAESSLLSRPHPVFTVLP